jgi:hypothetical protein
MRRHAESFSMKNDIELTEEEMSQFVLWLLLTTEFARLTRPRQIEPEPSGKE